MKTLKEKTVDFYIDTWPLPLVIILSMGMLALTIVLFWMTKQYGGAS